MLYMLVIVLIAIPFAVAFSVDSFHQPIQGDQTTMESNWPIKAGISFLAILIMMKMLQLSNNVIVRKPILRQNPE